MSTLPYSLNQLFNITKIDVVQSLDTHALRATLEWIIQSLQNQTSNDDLLQKVDEASKDRSSMSSTIEDLVHKQGQLTKATEEFLKVQYVQAPELGILRMRIDKLEGELERQIKESSEATDRRNETISRLEAEVALLQEGQAKKETQGPETLSSDALEAISAEEPTAAAAGEASQGNNEVPSAEGDSSQGAKEVSGSEPETSRRGSISPEGRVLTLTAELEQLRNDVAELLQRSQGQEGLGSGDGTLEARVAQLEEDLGLLRDSAEQVEERMNDLQEASGLGATENGAESPADRVSKLIEDVEVLKQTANGLAGADAELAAGHSELRKLLADKAGRSELQALVEAGAIVTPGGAHADVKIGSGSSGEEVADAINGQTSKIRVLETKLLLLQGQLSEKGDAASQDSAIAQLAEIKAALGPLANPPTPGERDIQGRIAALEASQRRSSQSSEVLPRKRATADHDSAAAGDQFSSNENHRDAKRLSSNGQHTIMRELRAVQEAQQRLTGEMESKIGRHELTLLQALQAPSSGSTGNGGHDLLAAVNSMVAEKADKSQVEASLEMLQAAVLELGQEIKGSSVGRAPSKDFSKGLLSSQTADSSHMRDDIRHLQEGFAILCRATQILAVGEVPASLSTADSEGKRMQTLEDVSETTLRDISNLLDQGEFVQKMNQPDDNFLDAMDQRLAELEELLQHVKFPEPQKDVDRAIRRLTNELSALKRKLTESGALSGAGQQQNQQGEGDYAMLAGRPLMGFRCMACDRPLEKLEAFPHQAVASKGMPSTVHSEKGSKSHGIKKGVSSKKPGMPPMPRPPVHHIAYPKAAGFEDGGMQNWYSPGQGVGSAEVLPNRDIGPLVGPGGYRADHVLSRGNSRGAPGPRFSSSGGGGYSESQLGNPSSGFPSIHKTK